MKKENLRIVYLGTPDFAVAPLRALVEGGYRVVGVITMPDKPMGKHQSEPQPSPVKQYALSAGLPILQPDSLKDERFLDELRSWQADLQIVVAFRMLPRLVWEMPPMGTFNIHASLLPQYRGAAPINWAIINGETQTGITTFFLKHEIDTGEVIRQQPIAIGETENAGSLHDRLMKLGAEMVVETVDAILAGEARPIAQETMTAATESLKPAPKLFKENCRIDWDRPVDEVYNFIRGLAPYPGAWTELTTPAGDRSITLKIFETERIRQPHSLTAGTMVSDGKTHLDIAARDGLIRLKIFQQTGKKRMTAEEYLRGNNRLFQLK